MNFIKNNIPQMANNDMHVIPEAGQPDIKNAQQMEEPSSPTSPVSDTARRSTEDPFASQREAGFKWDMFNTDKNDSDMPPGASQTDRRMSKEWDASKVPPSRFQKREGSIHATPASRDGHIDRNKLKDFAEKYNKKKERRKSDA